MLSTWTCRRETACLARLCGGFINSPLCAQSREFSVLGPAHLDTPHQHEVASSWKSDTRSARQRPKGQPGPTQDVEKKQQTIAERTVGFKSMTWVQILVLPHLFHPHQVLCHHLDHNALLAILQGSSNQDMCVRALICKEPSSEVEPTSSF